MTNKNKQVVIDQQDVVDVLSCFLRRFIDAARRSNTYYPRFELKGKEMQRIIVDEVKLILKKFKNKQVDDGSGIVRKMLQKRIELLFVAIASLFMDIFEENATTSLD